jgi:hypothetical protein
MKNNQEVSRSQDRRNPNPKAKLQKPDYLVWDTGVSDFFSEQIVPD